MVKAPKGRASQQTEVSKESSLPEGTVSLLPLVEKEIIPRLMKAHRDRSADMHIPPATEVEEFAEAILSKEPSFASQQIERLCANGLSIESVFLYLLTPAARLIGVLWENDLCSFSQVTLALWRIQQIMYDLSPAFHASRNPGHATARQRRILISTIPGSQHTFGLSMLSEFFRGDGWTVLAIPSPDKNELMNSVASNWFDIFALSASTDREIDAAQRIISEARHCSCNPSLSIIVGGTLFLRRPELAQSMGADGMSEDAQGALALAAQLLKQQQVVRFN